MFILDIYIPFYFTSLRLNKRLDFKELDLDFDVLRGKIGGCIFCYYEILINIGYVTPRRIKLISVYLLNLIDDKGTT